MAYLGTGTMAGTLGAANTQTLARLPFIFDDSDAEGGTGSLLITPAYRVAGANTLQATLINAGAESLEVTLTLYGALATGTITAGDITAGLRFVPIREPLGLTIPAGEARSTEYADLAHPTVVAVVDRGGEAPYGVVPIYLSIGSSS